jgi:hypothetical protein
VTDKCPKCLRPVWDGGHALNARECSPYDKDACALAEELMLQRERAELAEKGIARLEAERDDLFDEVNWYKSREKIFNEAVEMRNGLTEEIDRWRTIARDFCAAHDPLGTSEVTPGVFWAVAQGVSVANASMREELRRRKEAEEEGHPPMCSQCAVPLGDAWCARCAGSVTVEKIAQWLEEPETDVRAKALAAVIRVRWK